MTWGPQFDEDGELSRSRGRLIAVVLLGAALVGVCALALCACASTSEHVGDAAITAGSAAVGAVVAGPLGAGIAGGVTSAWTANTGGAQQATMGLDGQILDMVALGFFARIGHFVDRWLLWCAVGLLVLWFAFPRTRRVLVSLVSWAWKVPRGDVTPIEAVRDVCLAAPRAVGLVSSEPIQRDTVPVMVPKPEVGKEVR